MHPGTAAARRQRRLVRTSTACAVVGISLALAASLAPAAVPTAGSQAPSLADLERLLNPSGVSRITPAEEMTAQQAFAAAHYNGLGLNAPVALSTAIARG